MKTNKFFIAAFAALTLISCVKDDATVENNKVGGPAKIELKLALPKLGTFTRSNDMNAVDEDIKVNDIIIFVTKADGNTLDCPPKFFTGAQIASGGVVPTITASTSAAYVFAIVNTGALSSGAFQSVGTIAQANRVALKVDGNPNAGSNCISENVWMGAGDNLTGGGTEADGTAILTTTLKLEYIPAKVYVKVVNQMKNYDKAAVILDGVSMINAGAWTCFTPESIINFVPKREYLPTGAKFYANGTDAAHFGSYVDEPHYNAQPDYETNPLYQWTGSDFPMMPANVDPGNGGTPITTAMVANEGFYAFPVIGNNDTYLTVYGRYSIDETTDPDNPVGNASTLTAPNFYWSYKFGDSSIPGATKITQAKKYIVTLTLQGDAWSNGGGGSVDPTNPPTPANVKITIETAKWIPEEINKPIE